MWVDPQTRWQAGTWQGEQASHGREPRRAGSRKTTGCAPASDFATWRKILFLRETWLFKTKNLGRPATRSPDKVVRLFVLRVSETSCGKSDKLDESRHRIWLLSSWRDRAVSNYVLGQTFCEKFYLGEMVFFWKIIVLGKRLKLGEFNHVLPHIKSNLFSHQIKLGCN